MSKQKEPYRLYSEVAGKHILGYEVEYREHRKKWPNGTISCWTAPFYNYEAECLYCGSVRFIGSTGMHKRIKNGTVHCRDCAEQRFGINQEIEARPPALQVDAKFPSPPALIEPLHFIWGMR